MTDFILNTSKITFLPIFVFTMFISNSLPQINEDAPSTSIQVGLYNEYLLSSNSQLALSNMKSLRSLAYKEKFNNNWGKVNIPESVSGDEFKPWESEKHFGTAVWELAIVELIPWILARYIRHWEDPSDNWAKVGFQSWWGNINNGWEYDGDNFETNNFARCSIF